MASLPGDELQRMQSYPENRLLGIILSDPCIHFVVFGLLALCIWRGYYGQKRSIPLAIVAGLAIGYGLLMEVYQGILPWRSFGLGDLVWNTLGILFVLALIGVSKAGKMGSRR
jgi:VanZ family protein